MKNTTLLLIACAVMLVGITFSGCNMNTMDMQLERTAETEVAGKLGIDVKNQKFFTTTVDIDVVKDSAGIVLEKKAVTVCFKSIIGDLSQTAKTPYDRLGSCKNEPAKHYDDDGQLRAVAIKLADEIAKDLLDQVTRDKPQAVAKNPAVTPSPIPKK